MKFSLSSYSHELISVSIDTEHIACAWICPQQNKSFLKITNSREAISNRTQFNLRAYERFDLDNLSPMQTLLYNPTQLKNYISLFLQKNNIQSAYITFAVSGPSIIEDFIILSTPSPKKSDFKQSYTSSHVWDYMYLYPNDQHHFTFNVHGISHALLLQLQLIAISLKINLYMVTTRSYPILNLYKFLMGTGFRYSIFSKSMQEVNNDSQMLINFKQVANLLTINSQISLSLEAEAQYLTASLGQVVSSSFYTCN